LAGLWWKNVNSGVFNFEVLNRWALCMESGGLYVLVLDVGRVQISSELYMQSTGWPRHRFSNSVIWSNFGCNLILRRRRKVGIKLFKLLPVKRKVHRLSESVPTHSTRHTSFHSSTKSLRRSLSKVVSDTAIHTIYVPITIIQFNNPWNLG